MLIVWKSFWTTFQLQSHYTFISCHRQREKKRNVHCPCSRKTICTDEMKLFNNNWDSNYSSVKYSQSEEMLAKWETSVTPSKTKHPVFKSLSSYCEITMRIILIAIPEDMLSRCDSSASSSTGNHCLETIHEMQFTM